jgi:hypothetical protein
MGYSTLYCLEQVRDAIPDDEFAALIAEDANSAYALEPDGSSKNWEKWYNHEESLCKWSSLHPTTVFRLGAVGEDETGIWEKYFVDGKLVHAGAFSGFPPVDLEAL